MTKKRLTDLLIKQMETPKSGQITYFDQALPGFGLRVSQGGSKSFVLVFGPNRALRTLGRYPDLGLADARKLAKQVQGELLAKPEQQKSAIKSIRFAEARNQFLEDCSKRIKPSTFIEYKRLLERHFVFSNELHALTRQDVMTAIRELSLKPSIEQHAFVAIRTMMNWCVQHGLLENSPVPSLRFKASSRARILTEDELKAVWGRAVETGYPYGTMVQLLILTGQRRGEIAGLRSAWIKDGWITFPIGFTKNKREHRIPLGNLAKEIVESVTSKTDLFFPARGRIDVPFSGWSKSKNEFDKPLGFADYTLHDLRRTFSSNLAKLAVPIHVTEKLLNHVSGTVSGVAAVYNRHSYAAEMQDAIATHEKYLHNLVAQSI